MNKILALSIATLLMLFIFITAGCQFLDAEPDSDEILYSEQKIDQVDIADIAVDYILDYENGTTAIGELPIGTRIADPTWNWEYRPGYSYSNECPSILEPLDPGEIKPVTWIIVANDHYDIPESHVTLMAEEVIGLYSFDGTPESARFDDYMGHNHWGNSGTTDSIPGLRPWLNSTGSFSDEGFYQAFSESFKNSIITTDVPNREWETGDHYYTRDNVFIPSTTELGDTDHFYSYQIGTTYSYFSDASSIDRSASLDYEPTDYWTRTPASYSEERIFLVRSNGNFNDVQPYDWTNGVWPVVNVRPDVMVSVYEK